MDGDVVERNCACWTGVGGGSVGEQRERHGVRHRLVAGDRRMQAIA
jgi:hypothetical protein